MTTLAYPLYLKRPEPDQSTLGLIKANVPGRYSVRISVGQTGAGPGTTTIPLFVAPNGVKFYEANLDITTAFDSTANTNITVGTPGNPATLVAATTVNTEGRRAYGGSAAQVSTNAIALTADTTVQAIVSITTSAVTVGEVIVHVVIY